MMIYLDAGTTYSKIIGVGVGVNDKDLLKDLDSHLVKKEGDRNYYILPSSRIKSLNLDIRKCCGHMAEASENEIIALAEGCKNFVDKDATILDLGSRDAKWVRFKDGKFHDMDWNTSCASSTGATVEMLLKFYNLKREDLSFNEEKFAVTCGIFGLEKIMDDISNGAKSTDAISKFVHGIAYNAWNFAKKPEKIYLSGGFCENKCFVDSLKYYCKVETLGRFILCEGLINSDKELAHV
jgi:hypothetical protein